MIESRLQTTNFKYSNLSFQFMAATLSGKIGLVVVGLVVQEVNPVVVIAQGLGQQTEDDRVFILDQA